MTTETAETPSTPPPTEPLSPRTPRASELNNTLPHVSDPNLTNLLASLTRKPTVSSVLILSRESGAILRTEGQISSSSTLSRANVGSGGTSGGIEGDDEAVKEEMERLKNVAAMVWGFVGEAEKVGAELCGEDEGGVRLLRLRVGRREVVVVPDKKYILVVVHDAPGS